jgi:hypothetical protein
VTALLLKDLQVLRPGWWLIVLVCLLFGANGIVSPEMFFGMNVLLALALTGGLLVVEWKQDADRFVGSLPVSRKDVVRARYLWALGVAMAGTVVYPVYGGVLLGFGTERLLQRWPTPPAWESPEGLLAFFVTVWLVSVAYLPFYFRSGLGKGTGLFLASLVPVIVGGAALVRWLSPSSTLTAAAEVMGTPLTVVGALALAAALGWLSLRLAVRFYDRRDL